MNRKTLISMLAAATAAVGMAFGFASLADYELVSQVDLDEDIWSVTLGTKTETRAGRPVVAKLKRRDPVKEERKILFFDDNLRTIAESTYSRGAGVSEKGEYVCIGSDVIPQGERGTRKWEFYDRRARKHGQIEVPIEPDDATGIILSDAGSFIEVEPRAQYVADSLGVTLHRKEGENYRRVMIAKRGLLEHADISSDGRFVLLLVNLREGQGRTNVFLYNSDGRQVWRFIPEERQYRFPPSFSMSGDGSFVVASFASSADTVSYLLDRNGTVVARILQMSPGWVEFSPSGRYALFISGWRMMLVETSTGRTLFDYRSNQFINEGDIAEEGRIVGFVGRRSLVLLDFGGNQIWSLPFSPGPLILQKISLSSDGDEISLVNGTRFSVFRRVR